MDNSKVFQNEVMMNAKDLTAFINIKTGRLKIHLPTLSISKGNFQINTSLVYNSLFDSTLFPNKIIGIDNKWKFNFQQYVFQYQNNESYGDIENGDYVYIDGEWNIHRFIEYKRDNDIRYSYDSGGLNLRLLISSQKLEIDNGKEILEFNEKGYLIGIRNKFNHEIYKSFDYSNNKISSIKDERKTYHKINIIYGDNGKIKYVLDGSESRNMLLYNDNGDLKGITYQFGTYELDKYLFNYIDNKLVGIINYQTNNGLSISYNNYKAHEISSGFFEKKKKSIEKIPNMYLGDDYIDEELYVNDKCEYKDDKASDYYLSTINERFRITYDNSKTKVQQKNGLIDVYYLNNEGETISVLEEYDTILKSKFKNTGFPLTPSVSNLMDNKFIEISDKLCIETNTVNKFKKLLTDGTLNVNDDEKYRSFVVSFWLKNNIEISDFKKVLLNINGCEEFVYIKPSPADTIQYVQIPIVLNEDSFNSITNNYIEIEFVDKNVYKIADVKIKKSSINFLMLNCINENNQMFMYRLDNIETFGYLNGSSPIEKNINKDYYFTINDLIETYKSMYKAKCLDEARYELHCCNLRKVIEVSDTYFKVYQNFLIYLDFFNNRTANFRMKNVTFFKNNKYLIEDTVMSFDYDVLKNQYYCEEKKMMALTNSECDLTDDISSLVYTWYNEDGTFRAKKDEYNIITENYYDLYGNIEKILVYKENEIENPISVKLYNYDVDPIDREVCDSINNNGIETIFEYTPDLKLNKVRCGNNIKKYDYNWIDNSLKAISHVIEVFDEKGISHEEDIEKVEVLSNNKGLVRYYKKSDNEIYKFEYDKYLRLNKVYLNEKELEDRFYSFDTYGGNNFDKIKWMNNEILTFYDETHNVDKVLNRKYNEEGYEQKQLQMYDDYKDAYFTLNNVPYNETQEIIYDTTYFDNYCNNTLTIFDEFINALHVNTKNDFISKSTYKLVGPNETIYQQNSYLQNEVEYDILLDEEKRLRYKVETVTDTIQGRTRYYTPRITNNKYYRYLGLINKMYEEIEQASKQYKYDLKGRYLGYSSEKEYFRNGDTEDVFFKVHSVDNTKIYYDTTSCFEKNIEYTTPFSNSSNDECKKIMFPTKVNYLCLRKSLYYSSDSVTLSSEINIDETGKITKNKISGKYFTSNLLRSDTLETADLDAVEYSFTYDDVDRLSIEKIDNLKTNETSIFNYNYSSQSGDLVSILKNGSTFKTYEHIPVEEPTDDRYNLCKYKIYNGGNINENLIYYDKFGNISYINNNKLEYGYNNLLSKYIYDGNNTSNEFNIIDYKYDGLGKRVSKRVQKNNGNYLIEYKYDGNKLICENRYSYTNSNVDNKELTYSFVYTYDYDGLSGIIVYDYLNSRYQSSRYVQGGIYYNYVKDALGNIIGLVRDSKLVCKYSYDAWGNYTLNEYLDEESTYRDLDQFVIDNNPFRYKGYYYDVETGLALVSSRYYSPELGRFIQPADVSSLNPQSINGLNLYTYAVNNPIAIKYDSSISGYCSGMVSCLPGSGSANRGNIGGTLSSWFTSLPEVPKALKHISKANDVFSTMAHSAIVSNYLFHNLAFMDDMLMIGVNPAKALGYFSKASWITKVGNFFAAVDGIITVYDNLQQGNSLEQALLDGVMSFGVSAASAWVGGFVGANVGGAIGSFIGSFIPIPIVGTAIGFIVGTAIGVGVSWVVDNLLGYVKDEFLEWLFN
ncbi:MAG: hypothetical protein IJE45_03060 [Bacilli bacterium]|nr:hypothetical protein [Bacilli bacterium]